MQVVSDVNTDSGLDTHVDIHFIIIYQTMLYYSTAVPRREGGGRGWIPHCTYVAVPLYSQYFDGRVKHTRPVEGEVSILSV